MMLREIMVTQCSESALNTLTACSNNSAGNYVCEQ
jgi:hypothetical protein